MDLTRKRGQQGEKKKQRKRREGLEGLETASVSTAVMTRSEMGYFSGLIIASYLSWAKAAIRMAFRRGAAV